MGESQRPEPGRGEGSLERRHRREDAIARRKLWLSERDAFLKSSLESGEEVLAQSGSDPVVTDRRILSATLVRDPSSGSGWILDALPFDQIVGWSEGAHHDGRPILRLTHHPLTRIKWIPARRFLWWSWGNAVGPVVETTTSFAFGRRTDPVLRSIGAELDRRSVPRGPSFVIRPAGTRAARMRGSRASLRMDRHRRAGRIPHMWYRATAERSVRPTDADPSDQPMP
jgi:hypothetical protein